MCLAGQPGNSWTAGAPGLATAGNGPGLVYNGEMWEFGNNRVWSSPNGINWTAVSTPSFMSGRSGEGGVVANGEMFVIGGDVSGTLMNDIWSSSDGVNWAEVTASAGFTPREYFGVYFYNNEMWVVGGETGSGVVQDGWSSNNGSSWTEVTNSTGFGARGGFGYCVFNNAMWVISGYNFIGEPGSIYYGDAWYSTNGSTWTEASSTGLPADDQVQAVACGNAMWVMGGSNPGGFNASVRVTTDGVNWNTTNPSTPFNSGLSTTLSWNGTVWALGSQTSGNNWTWSSGCCLVPTPTNTPAGQGSIIKALGSVVTIIGGGSTSTPSPTSTPTSTITSTPTSTPSPTETAIPANDFVVVPAPNISRSGEPIQFEVTLGTSAQIKLVIYSLLGEQVYQTTVQGEVGVNNLLWQVRNQSNNPVASGIYIFTIQAIDGEGVQNKVGKVLVLH
jgi:hypothetical protein